MEQERNVISKEDLKIQMEYLSKIYDIVRLVDPEQTEVITLEDGQFVHEQLDPCFSVWEKDERCENCVSLKACMLDHRMTKFEFREEAAYYVIAIPYYVQDEGKNIRVSMELVNKVDESLQMNVNGVETLQQYVDEENNTLNQIVQNVPAGLFVFKMDSDKNVILKEANPSACSLMGIDFNKTIGAGKDIIFELTHPEDRPLMEKTIRKMSIPGALVHYEYRQYNKVKKEYCWLSAMSHSVLQRDGNIYIYVSYFDITEQKAAQKLREDLKIAQMENQAKTDFMSNMSHDMRTPLNGILGLAHLMIEKDDVEELHKDAEQLVISGKLLLNLINDTLDMNKIESGKLQLNMKPMDSGSVFENVVSTVAILANQSGVGLVYDVPNIPRDKWIPVISDSSRIEQILINIISNAIKYSGEDDIVELHMRTLSITEDMVVDEYSIVDHGIGMSEEFLPHLFEPFVQEGRKNAVRTQGSGLGMSIVKYLVELLGGDIKVESHMNEGTTVTLVMRYQVYKGDELDEKEGNQLDIDIKGMHILLCEDHPLNQQIAVELLKNQGAMVDVADNGKIGLEMFEKSDEYSYDAILMDVRMPVMDGIEAAKAIRSSGRNDSFTVPILAMTANAFVEDKVETRKAGMNEHLAKPVDPERLYSVLTQYYHQNPEDRGL